MSNHEQRENIFYSKCLIQSQVCVLIIDNGNCANLARTAVVDYLKLPTTKLAKPYTHQWLNEEELRVHEQVLIKFQIGKYQDVVLCNGIPMQASHVLLRRPWQHSHASTHDGRQNTYTVMLMGCKKKEEGDVEAKAQGEGEKRKLKGKAKLLLAEHKEIRRDVGVENALILATQRDHKLPANPSNSSPPHSISFLLQDPREALSMDTLVGCPDISKGVSFQGEEALSCRHLVESPGEASPNHRCDHLPTGLACLHADVAALLDHIETEPESSPAVPKDEVVITTLFSDTMPPPDFSLTTRKCPYSDHTIDTEVARHLRKKE
ncbi:hypothetical protein KY284_007864 [Solanum tuberosum]|nr:hypothetical protein KY284_007864 [Solanum tuberosum]